MTETDQELYTTDATAYIDPDGADDEGCEGPSLYEHYRVEASKNQEFVRVDKFLISHLSGISRNRIQKAADAGFIMCNDRPVKRSYKVKPCDVIKVMLDRPFYEVKITAEDIPLDIVYEDADLIVINKQAGLVVHPGFGNWNGTLLNALAWHMREHSDFDINNPEIGLVHRIDKDTSGLLVVAKTPSAKTSLGLQFFNKSTRREYNALVWGAFKEDKGTIRGNIARNPHDRMQMAVFPDGSETGKHAVTHYEVIEQFPYVSLVRCVLETGRTHQIRAHMKHIGHSLFNDARYGGDQILRGVQFAKYRQFISNCFAICPRQALHAKTLGFVHPRTGRQMDFTSELPSDMQALLERWRKIDLDFN